MKIILFTILLFGAAIAQEETEPDDAPPAPGLLSIVGISRSSSASSSTSVSVGGPEVEPQPETEDDSDEADEIPAGLVGSSIFPQVFPAIVEPQIQIDPPMPEILIEHPPMDPAGIIRSLLRGVEDDVIDKLAAMVPIDEYGNIEGVFDIFDFLRKEGYGPEMRIPEFSGSGYDPEMGIPEFSGSGDVMYPLYIEPMPYYEESMVNFGPEVIAYASAGSSGMDKNMEMEMEECPTITAASSTKNRIKAWLCEYAKYTVDTITWVEKFEEWWAGCDESEDGANIWGDSNGCPDTSMVKCNNEGKLKCMDDRMGCMRCVCSDGCYKNESSLLKLWKKEMKMFKERFEIYKAKVESCTLSGGPVTVACDEETKDRDEGQSGDEPDMDEESGY